MRLAVIIVVLQICDCKQHTKPKSRSVNLALETVLQFDKNENSADLQVIDKVQDFLHQIKSYIGTPKSYRKSYNERKLTFTEFIKNAILILNDYNDNDLEDLAAVVNDEIRKYHYKGCRFYELIENHDFRRFMANKLDRITNASAENIRHRLNLLLNSLQGENLGLKHRMIAKYIDALYNKDDAFKLGKFLDNLSLYRRKSKRSSSDLVKIVRNGLRSIIFDHYSKLDGETRRDIKIKLETIWKDYNGLKLHHRIWKFDTFTKLTKVDVKTETTPNQDSFESLEHTKTVPIKHPDRKKKEQIEEEDSIERDLNKMKQSTNKRKLTFITLYPEAITFKKRKHKEITNRDYTETTYEKPRRVRTRQRSKYNREAAKEIISGNKASIFVEKQKATAVDENYDYDRRNPKTKKMRYNIVRRYPEPRPTTFYSKIRLNTRFNARKFNPKLAADSSDGISIEIRNKKRSRKNNDNDAFNLTDVTTVNNTITTEIDYKKRVYELEKELEVVKAQMTEKTNVTEVTLPPNEILDFWEGTTTPQAEDNQTTVNYTTSELTTEVNETVDTTPSTPKIVFRSKDESLELDTSELKTNQTLKSTKTTREKLATKIDKLATRIATKDKKKNAKAKQKTTVNISSNTTEKQANKTKVKELSRKNVDEEAPLSEIEEENEIFDVQAYLNETRPTDEKSEIVRQKILEDVQKIMSESEADVNEVTPPDTTVIPTIGVDDATDLLDIINDSI